MKKLRTVALVARRPGYLVLRDALLADPGLELAAVFTHGKLPKAEGGAQRGDLDDFQALCAAHNVPLQVVDFPAAKDIGPYLPPGRFDLMFSLSWRSVVPAHVVERFAMTVNLHRGALPDYPGAEPVRRAIEAGERRVAITAHWMGIEIDTGDKIAEVWHDIAPWPKDQMTSAEYAEVVKRDLEPLYAPLATLAIAARCRAGQAFARAAA